MIIIARCWLLICSVNWISSTKVKSKKLTSGCWAYRLDVDQRIVPARSLFYFVDKGLGKVHAFFPSFSLKRTLYYLHKPGFEEGYLCKGKLALVVTRSSLNIERRPTYMTVWFLIPQLKSSRKIARRKIHCHWREDYSTSSVRHATTIDVLGEHPFPQLSQ